MRGWLNPETNYVTLEGDDWAPLNPGAPFAFINRTNGTVWSIHDYGPHAVADRNTMWRNAGHVTVSGTTQISGQQSQPPPQTEENNAENTLVIVVTEQGQPQPGQEEQTGDTVMMTSEQGQHQGEQRQTAENADMEVSIEEPSPRPTSALWNCWATSSKKK